MQPSGQGRQIAVPESIAALGNMPLPGLNESNTATSQVYGSSASWVSSTDARPKSSAPSASTTARKPPDILKSGEFWLSRVGIVLFLLGIGFLFKYSVDQGWLTEWVRVAMGFVAGAALLVIGSLMGAHRQALKYILLGGSIATFYITGYAAYQLFHLVAYELAFSFMVAVTVLAFVLALGHNQSLLSIVGVAGGLATPFVLGDRSGGVTGLVTYTCLVAAGAVAVYFFRGWRGLLWTTFVGTWLVLLAGLEGAKRFGAGPDGDWALQAGAIFCLLVFWVVPLVRETLRAINPERWPSSSLDYVHDKDLRNLLESQVHALVVLAPLTTLGFSWRLWEATVPSEVLGAATLAGAVLFGAVAWSLRRSQERLAYTHAVVGVLLLTLALVQLIHGNVLMLALAVEAAALHFVARRLSDRGTSVMGHILSGCVALWVVSQLWRDIVGPIFGTARLDELPFLNAQALTYLTVLGLSLAASFVVRPQGTSVLYRGMVHLVVLGTIWRELAGRPDGWSYIILGWAVYGTLLQAVYWWAPGRTNRAETVVPSHIILGLVALQLMLRLLYGAAPGPVFFNLPNLVDVAVILLVAGVSFLHKERGVQLLYRGAAHLALLALLWRELETLPNGNAFVTIAWGVWACVLLLAGIRFNRNAPLLYAGAGTLVLLVAKLFLIDLVGLEAIWRVLIFLGVGGLFLVLSYYLQNVLKRAPLLSEDADGRQG
jgi:hypothetical protein